MNNPSSTQAEPTAQAVQPVTTAGPAVENAYSQMNAEQLGYWRETMNRARMYAKAARFARNEGYGAIYAKIGCSLYREAALFRETFRIGGYAAKYAAKVPA